MTDNTTNNTADTTAMLEKYFELRTAYRAASDRAHARRDELCAELEISFVEADRRPEYRALSEEATRLYWEADALTPYPIRANLTRFEIEDMTVTGVLVNQGRGRDCQKLGEIQITLSDLCGLRHRGLAKKLEIDEQEIGRIVVMQNEERIGTIDSDGQFHYEAAPDLRSCLGWAVATDLGREQLLDYDLDSETEELTRSIRMAPPLDEEEIIIEGFFFNGAFAKQIQKTMENGRGSRFGDGYCGVKNLFWQVGTRTLRGQEHPGFAFAY